MKKVRMTDEEARRILAERTKGVLDPARVRVLLPSAGGPNTPPAALVAAALTKRSADPLHVMFVQAPTRVRDRFAALFRPRPPSVAVDEQLEKIRRLITDAPPLVVRRVENRQVAPAILLEAERGFDVIVLGASHEGHSLGGPVLVDVIEGAPCHVVVVKAGPHGSLQPCRSVLVPFDGGVFARVAVELAVRYAEATGAELTIALISEPRVQLVRPLDSAAVERGPAALAERADDEDVSRISNIFRATELRPNIVRLGYDPVSSAMVREAASGRYDLVMIGAENRAIQHRLFFGHDNERLIRDAPVTVAIVIPNVAFLGKDDRSAIASLQRPHGTPPEGEGTPPRAASSV
jgi:nucleotide-binding universal stress UspA family protein